MLPASIDDVVLTNAAEEQAPEATGDGGGLASPVTPKAASCCITANTAQGRRRWRTCLAVPAGATARG